MYERKQVGCRLTRCGDTGFLGYPAAVSSFLIIEANSSADHSLGGWPEARGQSGRAKWSMYRSMLKFLYCAKTDKLFQDNNYCI